MEVCINTDCPYNDDTYEGNCNKGEYEPAIAHDCVNAILNPIPKLKSETVSSSPTKLEWLLTAMNFIEKTFPLDLEWETDARYIWPKRWERLRQEAELIR